MSSLMPTATLEERLARIESLLCVIARQQQVRDFYTVEEFAGLVGRSEFTCREWCRLGRIRATKKRSGRGAHAAWVIAHREWLRYQREGLLAASGVEETELLIESSADSKDEEVPK